MDVKIISNSIISSLDSTKKIDKIYKMVKDGSLVILEGRLTNEEELALTSKSLKHVSETFSGIDIAFLNVKQNSSFFDKLRFKVATFLLKYEVGITVIGPSKKVKELKMNPEQIEILLFSQ
ncbi:MAG: DUF2073 domain-containing protein [Candidatus Woesearchaeota archaeon]